MSELRVSVDKDDEDCEQIWSGGSEIYRVTSDLIGSSVVRIGEFSFPLCQQIQKRRVKQVGDVSNELYWTIKSMRKPSPKSKWQYNLHGTHVQTSTRPKRLDLNEVFDRTEQNSGRTVEVMFRVRNWRQRPASLLRKKKPECDSQPPSNFAMLSSSNLKPTSKCFLVKSVLQFNDFVAMIL